MLGKNFPEHRVRMQLLFCCDFVRLSFGSRTPRVLDMELKFNKRSKGNWNREVYHSQVLRDG